jgi:hypothetical protein
MNTLISLSEEDIAYLYCDDKPTNTISQISRNFTFLMRLVMLTKKYPNIVDVIPDYHTTVNEEINNLSPLDIAFKYVGEYTTIDCIYVLIFLGAKIKTFPVISFLENRKLSSQDIRMFFETVCKKFDFSYTGTTKETILRITRKVGCNQQVINYLGGLLNESDDFDNFDDEYFNLERSIDDDLEKMHYQKQLKKLFTIKDGKSNKTEMQIPQFKLDKKTLDKPKGVTSLPKIPECIICLTNIPIHIAKPCHHLLYCDECLIKSKSSKCCVCNATVKKYSKIFF